MIFSRNWGLEAGVEAAAWKAALPSRRRRLPPLPFPLLCGESALILEELGGLATALVRGTKKHASGDWRVLKWST